MQSYKQVLSRILRIEEEEARIKISLAKVVIWAGASSILFLIILIAVPGCIDSLLQFRFIKFVVSNPKAASSILVTVIPFLYFLLMDEQIDGNREYLLRGIRAGIEPTPTVQMVDESLDPKEVKDIIIDQLKKKIDEEINFSEIKAK